MSEARAARLALPALVVAALLLTLVAAALARGAAPWRAAAGAALGLAAIALTWTGARSESAAGEGASPTAKRGRLADLARGARGRRPGARRRAAADAAGRLGRGPRHRARAARGPRAQRIQASSVEVAALGERRQADRLRARRRLVAAGGLGGRDHRRDGGARADRLADRRQRRGAGRARARAASASGDAGAAAVERAVAGVERVRERIARHRAPLGRARAARSQEIYGVLELVDRHRAGDPPAVAQRRHRGGRRARRHGRRFAVVAEEVRRLAARSREAVELGAPPARRVLGLDPRHRRGDAQAGAREAERVLARAREAAARRSRRLARRARRDRRVGARDLRRHRRAEDRLRRGGADAARGGRGRAADRRGAARLLGRRARARRSRRSTYSCWRRPSASTRRARSGTWPSAGRTALAPAARAARTRSSAGSRTCSRSRPDAECAYVFDPRALSRGDRGAARARSVTRDPRGDPLRRAASPRVPGTAPRSRSGAPIVTPVFVSLLTDERVVTAGGADRRRRRARRRCWAIDVNVERWTTG